MTEQINSQEPTQAELDEALMPDLSDDYFEINGKKLQLKPLTIKHQKQFAKTMAPVAASLSYVMAAAESENASNNTLLMAALSEIMQNAEILPKLVQILCHNAGYLISDDDLDNCTLSQEEQINILLRFLRKAGEMERKIADFFDYVLTSGRNELGRALDEAKQRIESETLKNTA